MIITNKLADLVEYKILLGEQHRLTEEVSTLETQLDEVDEVIDDMQTAGDTFKINFPLIMESLAEKRNKLDQERIKQALALNNIEKRLLEFELTPYKN